MRETRDRTQKKKKKKRAKVHDGRKVEEDSSKDGGGAREGGGQIARSLSKRGKVDAFPLARFSRICIFLGEADSGFHGQPKSRVSPIARCFTRPSTKIFSANFAGNRIRKRAAK